MLTGSITRRDTAEQALDSGVALIGIGTALAVPPDLPDRWRNGREADRQRRPVTWSDKTPSRRQHGAGPPPDAPHHPRNTPHPALAPHTP